MDVMALLEKLDAYLSECTRVPLVGRLIIDDLRAALPQEIEQAKWLLKERERIIGEARKEADDILRDAQGQIAALASESSIGKEAKAQAESLMERARDVARDINQGAREYADELMKRVEDVLSQALDGVKDGRRELVPDRGLSPTAETDPGEVYARQAASTQSSGPDDDEDWMQDDEAPPRKKRRRGGND